MDLFISTVGAQEVGTAAPAQAPNPIQTFLPLVIFIAIFYFLLIRPQQKRAKEHREMVGSLQVGTEIVTSGGVLGKVTKVGEQFLTVEVADGVELRVQRNTVGAVMPKGTVKSA